MKKKPAIKSDSVVFLKMLISPQREVVEMFMENSHLVFILDTGLRVKMKQLDYRFQ